MDEENFQKGELLIPRVGQPTRYVAASNIHERDIFTFDAEQQCHVQIAEEGMIDIKDLGGHLWKNVNPARLKRLEH